MKSEGWIGLRGEKGVFCIAILLFVTQTERGT
jgi:hypothetical protein